MTVQVIPETRIIFCDICGQPQEDADTTAFFTTRRHNGKLLKHIDMCSHCHQRIVDAIEQISTQEKKRHA